MQQAVLSHFPNALSTYRFTHRDRDVFFSKECYNCFVEAIPRELPTDVQPFSYSLFRSDFAQLEASKSELTWLKNTCPFFKPKYLEYLSTFRFKPNQVRTEFVPSLDDPEKGRIEITATGPWVEAILWEVPLMACLSELFFLTSDRDWSYDGQEGMTIEINHSIFLPSHRNCRSSI